MNNKNLGMALIILGSWHAVILLRQTLMTPSLNLLGVTTLRGLFLFCTLGFFGVWMIFLGRAVLKDFHFWKEKWFKDGERIPKLVIIMCYLTAALWFLAWLRQMNQIEIMGYDPFVGEQNVTLVYTGFMVILGFGMQRNLPWAHLISYISAVYFLFAFFIQFVIEFVYSYRYSAAGGMGILMLPFLLPLVVASIMLLSRLPKVLARILTKRQAA